MTTIWKIGNDRELKIDKNPCIMGILNCTPDSFSDGGRYTTPIRAQELIAQMVQEEVDIIDVGGESTRPGAQALSSQKEQNRILPIIENVAARFNVIISIDTYNTDTAEKALMKGAHIINDVWGLQKNPQIANVIAEHKAGVVIMHTSREREVLKDPIEDQKFFFETSLKIAHKAGIKDSQIVLDPGFGFGKNAEVNIFLMKNAKELQKFGYPLLAGTSRKRFLGTIGKEDAPEKRDVLTAASSIILRQEGFSLFRVHNVKATRQALALYDIIHPFKVR